MNVDRGEAITGLRLQLGLESGNSTDEEVFQNEVLRPILKFQNEIILAIFRDYIDRKKINLKQLTSFTRRELVQNCLSKDIAFKNSLKGCVIGFLTKEELGFYLNNQKNLNKRLISMLRERILSQDL